MSTFTRRFLEEYHTFYQLLLEKGRGMTTVGIYITMPTYLSSIHPESTEAIDFLLIMQYNTYQFWKRDVNAMTNQTVYNAVYSELKHYEPLNGVWFFDGMLGRGSSGVVFKLKDTSYNPPRYSAGKLIRIDRPNQTSQPESSQTMYNVEPANVMQEIAIASKLCNCKNIVKYLDHFIFEREDHSGQDIVIQSELLTSLFSFYSKHTLSEHDVLKIGIDICSALEEMEKIRVLHRDIKPSNVFITEDGTYKLGDFSIATYWDIPRGYRGTGGTLYYVAPEVYRKNSYDQRADIYSLGILMYRYLNNEQMSFASSEFTHEAEDPFSMQMNGALLRKPIHASTELAEVILKCCAYSPEDRYGSATELKRALLGIKQANQTRDIRPPKLKTDLDITRFITVNNTFDPFPFQPIPDKETKHTVGELPEHSAFLSDSSAEGELPPDEKTVKRMIRAARLERLMPKMVNWFCFTCMFSLMPLIIFLLCRGAFAPDYPWKIKLVMELLYLGLSLAVISIRELVNQEMWVKGQTPYLIALFVMLFILILAAVFFGIMTINDMNLLSIGIEENVLLWAAGLIGGVSFITATCIQIWKEW